MSSSNDSLSWSACQQAGLEGNGDMSGLGFRLSVYIQACILLLITHLDSEIDGMIDALVIMVATIIALAVGVSIQSHGELSFFDTQQATNLLYICVVSHIILSHVVLWGELLEFSDQDLDVAAFNKKRRQRPLVFFMEYIYPCLFMFGCVLLPLGKSLLKPLDSDQCALRVNITAIPLTSLRSGNKALKGTTLFLLVLIPQYSPKYLSNISPQMTQWTIKAIRKLPTLLPHRCIPIFRVLQWLVFKIAPIALQLYFIGANEVFVASNKSLVGTSTIYSVDFGQAVSLVLIIPMIPPFLRALGKWWSKHLAAKQNEGFKGSTYDDASGSLAMAEVEAQSPNPNLQQEDTYELGTVLTPTGATMRALLVASQCENCAKRARTEQLLALLTPDVASR